MDNFEFINSSDRMFKMLKKYSEYCIKHIDDFRSSVVYEQYGIGGETIHRGYYCPSKIEDIVVGNARRGRITKRKEDIDNPDYIYGFDKENRLITVRKQCEFEMIIYTEHSEIGLTFWESDKSIMLISECCYCNEKIKSYTLCNYNPYMNSFLEILTENYEYMENKMIVDRFGLYPMGKTHVRFDFTVENGYLKSYTVNEIGNEESIWRDRVLKVRIKRAV